MDNPDLHGDDVIDIREFVQTLWSGKWQIAGFVVVCVLAALAWYVSKMPANFLAKTDLQRISSFEAEAYRASNAIGFFQISPIGLQRLYIERIEEPALFEESIAKFGLLSRDEFESEQAFNDAVAALAATVEILPVEEETDPESNEIARDWQITFAYHDESKWKEVLSHVDEQANADVRETLRRRFASALEVETQKRAFELEDLNVQIDNALADYDREILARLAFLREQAAIARELGLAKNTLEAQTFDLQNGTVANVNTNTPFYFRGYESIEKEIELIESREDGRLFAEPLVELEQQKRAIEQNQILARAQAFFETTPVTKDGEFNAVSLRITATRFVYQNTLVTALAVAVLLGLFLGVCYVLLSNLLGKQRQAE